VDDTYYAIFKDERYPSFDWPTGKSIRISSSKSLTGPYSEPGPSVSPNFREAASIAPRLDREGWYMYFERYPGNQYEIATAPRLEGSWYDVYIQEFDIPSGTRHGCVIPITQRQRDDIMAAYGDK
jgi:hypothetical protein